LAVFKERAIDFGALLDHFFPRLRHRLIDSINPVLNAFDSERIIDMMRSHVERLWKELEKAGNEKGLFDLVDVFWFTRRTDTLLWIRDQIDALEPEPVELASITFKKNSTTVPSPSILSVLRSFTFAGPDEVGMALELLSRYFAKRPAEAPFILQVLIDDYGFSPDSYLKHYQVQRAVVDELCKCAENADPLFSRMLLAVADSFLGTHFEKSGLKDAHLVQFTRFDLPATSDLFSLREVFWQRLTALYEQEELQGMVLEVIHHYSTSFYKVTDSEIARTDAKYVLPFLVSVLDPSSYPHCTMMHDYLNFLENHDGEVPKGLRDRFRNDTFALAEIIRREWGEQGLSDLSYEDYEQCMRDQLDAHTAGYALDDYECFFERGQEIQRTLEKEGNEYLLQQGVVNVLLSLAERDATLYCRVLPRYLRLQDPLKLQHGYILVRKLIELQGHEKAFQMISEPEYPSKNRWLFHFHEVLPSGEIDVGDLAHLYELYETAEPEDLPQSFDYLLKYLPLDARVVAKIVLKLLKKTENNPNTANRLTMLFNPYAEVAKRLPDLFVADLDLLKRAYLTVEDTRRHSDNKGQVFGLLLDLDPTFIAEYVDWKYSKAKSGRLSSHDDKRDYSFIWNRPNHQDVIKRVVECVYGHEQDCFFNDPYLKTFFQGSGNSDEAGRETRKRQDVYLLRLIDEMSDDADFMKYLFALISHFSPDRRRMFVERLLQQNRSFDLFTRLRLEPSCWYGIGGSLVPVLQDRVNFRESLLPLMSTVDLLRHKQYTERHIQMLRTEIEREKKKDFIGD